MPYKYKYIDFNLLTCTYGAEVSVICESLSELVTATVDWETCGITEETDAEQECCDGEGVSYTGTGSEASPPTGIPAVLIEYSTYNFDTCEVEDKECIYMQICNIFDDDPYEVVGTECFLDMRGETNPPEDLPRFPNQLNCRIDTLYWVRGAHTVGASGVGTSTMFDSFGTNIFQVPYVGNALPPEVETGFGGIYFDDLTQAYVYSISENIDPTTGIVIDNLQPARRLDILLLVNEEYFDDTGTGTGIRLGCLGQAWVGYFHPSIGDSTNLGIPFSGSPTHGYQRSDFGPPVDITGKNSIQQYYPEPVRFEFEERLMFYDYDVPPLRVRDCPTTPLPDELNLVVSGFGAGFNYSLDGTFILTYLNGVYTAYREEPTTDIFGTVIGRDYIEYAFRVTQAEGFTGPPLCWSTIMIRHTTFASPSSVNSSYIKYGQDSITCAPFQWVGLSTGVRYMTVTE